MYYRQDHTFDVKTCFQQNRYEFDVIVTSWALFDFCISWNFTHDISMVFEEIKILRSREPENIFYQIIKINKTQILLKYFFFWFHEVLNFLKNDVNMFKYSKRLDDVLIFEKHFLQWKTMVCRHVSVIYKCKITNKINTISSKIVFFHQPPITDYIFSSGILK